MISINWTNPYRVVEVREALKLLEEDSSQVFFDDVSTFAFKLKELAVEAILTKGSSIGVSWTNNSLETIRKKGFDHPLLDSGFYIKNIDVFVDQKQFRRKLLGKRTRYTEFDIKINPYIVHPGRRKTEGKITLERVATILEYGAKNIPARPLWRPLAEYAENNSDKFFIRRKTKFYRFIGHIDRLLGGI